MSKGESYKDSQIAHWQAQKKEAETKLDALNATFKDVLSFDNETALKVGDIITKNKTKWVVLSTAGPDEIGAIEVAEGIYWNIFAYGKHVAHISMIERRNRDEKEVAVEA